MLLQDLLDGVDLEGFIIVQCWESCMFPYLNNQAAAFCIELES